MPLNPGLCARCKSNIRLSYHPYCKACKAEYAREHPQKYKPHPLPKLTWEQLFWPKVDKTDDCWLWNASKDRRGYPRFRVGKISTDPGRFLYEQLHGVIPDGLVLYRTCRIKCCVNPAHLAVGKRDELPREPVKERFEANVNRNGPVPKHRPELGPCHEYMGRKSAFGYGQFWFNGRDEGAHRVAWQFAHGIGSIPKDKWVCHKCDNRSCVNVNHLFLGTPDDDIKDMMSKGRSRHPRGEDAGKAKLTASQVLEIRRDYDAMTNGLKKLALKYGVTSQAIMSIIRRRSWAHI